MSKQELSSRNEFQKEEKCCGDCCWFKHENIVGDGFCYSKEVEIEYGCDTFCNCSCDACKHYISEQEMRHHLATLMLHNRWRRSNVPTGFYKMQDPKEIGLAIDFSIKYIKTFMEL